MSMIKLLMWKKDGKPAFSGQTFKIFPVRWDKRKRKWVDDPKGRKWGLIHPVTGRIVGLRKAPETYGIVNDIEIIKEETPDVETRVEIGTPTLGIVDEEE